MKGQINLFKFKFMTRFREITYHSAKAEERKLLMSQNTFDFTIVK